MFASDMLRIKPGAARDRNRGGLRKEQGRNSDPETGIPASVQADEAGALPGIEAGKN